MGAHVYRSSQLKPQFANAHGSRTSVTKENFPILRGCRCIVWCSGRAPFASPTGIAMPTSWLMPDGIDARDHLRQWQQPEFLHYRCRRDVHHSQRAPACNRIVLRRRPCEAHRFAIEPCNGRDDRGDRWWVDALAPNPSRASPMRYRTEGRRARLRGVSVPKVGGTRT